MTMRTERAPRTLRVLACLACWALWFVPQAPGGELNILWPSSRAQALSPEPSAPPVREPYEIRRGGVEVPLRLKEMCDQAEVGDTLRLTFFAAPASASSASPARTVTVVAVERNPLNVVSLRGRLEGQEIESFVLTVSDDGFLISCQDGESGILFRARGNPRTGSGNVTEVDLTKIPPRKCGVCTSPAQEEEAHE